MAEPERGRGERRVSGKIAEKEDEGGRQEVVVDGGVHHQIDAKNGSIRGKKGREGLQSHYHGKGENHFPLSLVRATQTSLFRSYASKGQEAIMSSR